MIWLQKSDLCLMTKPQSLHWYLSGTKCIRMTCCLAEEMFVDTRLQNVHRIWPFGFLITMFKLNLVSPDRPAGISGISPDRPAGIAGAACCPSSPSASSDPSEESWSRFLKSIRKVSFFETFILQIGKNVEKTFENLLIKPKLQRRKLS